MIRLVFAFLVAFFFFFSAASAAQEAPKIVSPAIPYLMQDGTLRPVPDPTLLTTQAQEKSIAALRELLDARLNSLEKRIVERYDDLKFQEARSVKRLDEIPRSILEQVNNLAALMNEKFKGVDQQFQGRDTALAAALLAQKTSVDEQNKANAASAAKQEGAITKQIDGIQSIITVNSKSTDDKIEAVRLLITAQTKTTDDKIVEMRATIADLRASQVAMTSRGAGQSDLLGWMVGGAGVLIALVSLVVRFGSPQMVRARP